MVGYAHWAHTNNRILVTIMQRSILLTTTTIFAVLLSLGLTGCGGSSDSGESTIQEAAGIVGNPVLEGQPYAGPEVCRWDTEDTDHVSLLLTVRLGGSSRAQVLCENLSRMIDSGGEPVNGLGDQAVFKFSGVAGMFDSGDLEACSPEGFVSVSLNGKKDEAAMKEAAIALTRMVFSRL
jgi:hypothetical protein